MRNYFTNRKISSEIDLKSRISKSDSPIFFNNCDFMNINFTGLNLAYSKFTNCRFYSCEMENEVAFNFIFDKCIFYDFISPSTAYSGCTINGCEFIDCDLLDSKFMHCNIYNSQYKFSSLEHCLFFGSTIKGCSVIESYINDSVINKCNGDVLFLDYSDITGLKLKDSELVLFKTDERIAA